jgi:hypothetical protein
MKAKRKSNRVARRNSQSNQLRMSQQKMPEGVPILATGELQLGRYCNVAVIHHTNREFVLDFVWRLDSASILASRVITSPQHAKEIYEVLGQNIQKFEKQYGAIASEWKPKT